jgi:hypothetical protein
LKRVAAAATSIGIAVVLLDILDDGNAELIARRRALYEHYGFSPMPTKPNRLFLPVDSIAALLGETR